MSTATTLPPKKVNRIGLEVVSYKGAKTTLCAGCGSQILGCGIHPDMRIIGVHTGHRHHALHRNCTGIERFKAVRGALAIGSQEYNTCAGTFDHLIEYRQFC